ncbi:hypothetical protein S245_031863 [Arachis hypogaea]
MQKLREKRSEQTAIDKVRLELDCLPPPSLKRASKPPSLSCSSVPPSCSYCFSFESTVAQLCFIVAGAISVPPVIPLVVDLSPSCLGSALLCSRASSF